MLTHNIESKEAFMILAAHQTNYFPYPGFFEKIARSDLFVLLDNVQYVRREWHNRNRLRTQSGWTWLTLPVHVAFKDKIRCAYPAQRGWSRSHWDHIMNHYRKSLWLDRLETIWSVITPIEMESLATINYHIILKTMELLGIHTTVVLQSQIGLTIKEERDPDTRLISLCRRFGCNQYLAGAGGRAYMNETKWMAAGITVTYQDYRLHAYPQLYPGWEPNLSILDLLLCVEYPHNYILENTKVPVLRPS